jgi:hypothetical protein
MGSHERGMEHTGSTGILTWFITCGLILTNKELIKCYF